MKGDSRSTTEVCPHCGERLRTYAIPAMYGGREHFMTIKCECEGAVRERRELEIRRRSGGLRAAWERTGVPKRYLDVAPDFARMEALTDGRGLYIFGDRGNGKTKAACSVLKAYVARHTSESGWCSARFMSASRWLDSIQDTYGRWSASAEDAFQRAAGVNFLVLDDIGKVGSRVSEWSVGKLFRLVDERYNDKKTTVFTSRYKLSGLAQRLAVEGDDETPGDMVSRIRETCEAIPMMGRDYRIGNGAC